MGEPAVSVIIPTYNRRDDLRLTLESLVAQEFPAAEFEVVVADDGSSDGTAELAASFDGPLRLRYAWQEDRGYRLAAARNLGARHATAPIFASLDAGTLAGPGYVGGHLAAHSAPGRRAVLGYCYGYDGLRAQKWVPDSLGTVSLPELVRLNADHPLFQDIRHSEFARVGFDPMKLAVPWIHFATMNCSMRAEEFWAIGGFDEMFHSWGMEDTEFGYRLCRNGVALTLSLDAWTIELPVDRAVKRRLGSLVRNARMFHGKFPEPVVEMLFDQLRNFEMTPMEADAVMLADWTGQARELDVAAEIESALRELPAGASVVVFGCGGSVPASLPPAVLLDFDAALLAKATADGRHAGHHAIGLHTLLAAKSADAVIVTSRLRGLWHRFGERITAEAQRVGQRVLDTGASN